MFIYSVCHKLLFNPLTILLLIPNLLPMNYLQLNIFKATSGLLMIPCDFSIYGVMWSSIFAYKPTCAWKYYLVEAGC